MADSDLQDPRLTEARNPRTAEIDRVAAEIAAGNLAAAALCEAVPAGGGGDDGDADAEGNGDEAGGRQGDYGQA